MTGVWQHGTFVTVGAGPPSLPCLWRSDDGTTIAVIDAVPHGAQCPAAHPADGGCVGLAGHDGPHPYHDDAWRLDLLDDVAGWPDREIAAVRVASTRPPSPPRP